MVASSCVFQGVRYLSYCGSSYSIFPPKCLGIVAQATVAGQKILLSLVETAP